MKLRGIWAVGFVGMVSIAGCGSSDSKDTAAKGAGGSSTTPDASVAKDALYVRLGKAAGIQAVVGDFLTRVKADAKINGYFLNSSLDAAHLSSCLVNQIGNATGGPEKYECKTMKDAHKDLHISKMDFDDLLGHLADALVAANVAQADVDTIRGVLDPMSADIVTDATNDGNIYQRVGRKPAIQAVVTAFHENLKGDTRINSFFAMANEERLGTCLVRQLCGATGGPCKYGEEIADAEPGIKDVCRTMKSTHAELDIGYSDFTALAEDVVKALDGAGVKPADRDAIVGALGTMCTDIVTNTTKGACP
jgi:truncated hemoglobin YjbI